MSEAEHIRAQIAGLAQALAILEDAREFGAALLIWRNLTKIEAYLGIGGNTLVQELHAEQRARLSAALCAEVE